jgi:hypothetical protein
MTGDEPKAADLLARARRAWTPSVGDAERVRRTIGAALAAGTPAGVPTAAPHAASWGTRLLAAATIAGISGGIGYWAGSRADHREAPPVRQIAPAPLPPAASVPRPAPSHEAQPSLAPSEPADPHHGVRPARHEAERSTPAPADSLAVEVRALRNAERALRDGNPGLALAFLEELDRQVPHGQLTEERDAAATLARCARGDHPIGVDLGGEFIDRYPASVYRARVEQACTATDSPAPGHSANRRPDQ